MLPIEFALIAIGGSFSARVKEKRTSIDEKKNPSKGTVTMNISTIVN